MPVLCTGYMDLHGIAVVRRIPLSLDMIEYFHDLIKLCTENKGEQLYENGESAKCK